MGMNITIKIPSVGIVSIMPDCGWPECPIYIQAGNHAAYRMARRYCKAEGWIELAEEDWSPDAAVVAFIESI